MADVILGYDNSNTPTGTNYSPVGDGIRLWSNIWTLTGADPGAVTAEAWFYRDGITIDSEVQICLYADDDVPGVNPGTLLASQVLTLPAGTGWVSTPFASPYTPSNGTDYWVAAFIKDDNALTDFYVGATNAGALRDTGGWLTDPPPPNPFGTLIIPTTDQLPFYILVSPLPTAVVVTLDGVDVTNVCVSGSWTRRLNRPSVAQIRMPMTSATALVGSALKIEALIGTTYEIVHHGHVLLREIDTDEDTGYAVYNSTDPMELWNWRPVRADDGDFSKPSGSGAVDGTDIIATYLYGTQIMEAALKNTEGDTTAQGNPALTPPSDTEGPTFLDFGTFEAGVTALTGAPVDWPMTIADFWALLCSTGTVDLVITPTDPGGGIMGTIDGYNGDYGTDLSSTIVFSYGMGDFNVRRLRWNDDMTSMCNKLWYYGGPRINTAADPAGDQHWCFNVTGDDPDLAYPPGGALSPPASATDNQLGVLRVNSQAAYGVRMDVQIFDAYDDCVGVGTIGRDLYRYRWQQEAWLRAQPRGIIHVTPTRETEIGTFDIGDLVGVEAVSDVAGGFSGVQRVYEYTVSWDSDGVLELSELQTSADNEGL